MGGFFDLIKLLLRCWDLIQTIIGAAKAKDAENWDTKIADGIKAYAALQTAKTPEERKNAEKDLSKHWLGN